MGLLNLALGQLLGLALPLTGLLVALYFYDRSRRSVVVSTLRFWPQRPAPPVRQRHKRIQHPLSLALQLAAVILLLVAIADPRPDQDSTAVRRRVIVLDTSAVMALANADGGLLMDQAKELALAYLDRLPSQDPALLVEADGSPRVRVPFTTDRQRVREAITTAAAGWTALDLDAAFDLANGSVGLALGSTEGSATEIADRAETVYIGPGRASGQSLVARSLPGFRLLETRPPEDSLGIQGMRATADVVELGKWFVELDARNFGETAAVARVKFLFDDSPLGFRNLSLPPKGDASMRFVLRTQRSGQLQAELEQPDAFQANDRATLPIPAPRRTALQVVGSTESEFAPLLAAGARIDASFVVSTEDLAENAIHVWARGGPPGGSARGIYLVPPGVDSPIVGETAVRRQAISEWSPSHAVAQGVRDPDLTPAVARVLEPAEGDEVVAAGEAGPLIVAREAPGTRLVAFGFDLADASVRGHLATPLLFANALAWLDSAAFRAQSVHTRPPGSVSVEAPNSTLEDVRVLGPSRDRVPWILEDGTVRFYTARPGSYRIVTADRDVTMHLTQPNVPAQDWEAPETAARGLPPALGNRSPDWLAWPWLAAAAGLILLADWSFFGRGRRLLEGTRPVSGRVGKAVER